MCFNCAGELVYPLDWCEEGVRHWRVFGFFAAGSQEVLAPDVMERGFPAYMREATNVPDLPLDDPTARDLRTARSGALLLQIRSTVLVDDIVVSGRRGVHSRCRPPTHRHHLDRRIEPDDTP